MDGSPTEGTLRFAMDSTEHETDLNADHARALRISRAPFPDPGATVTLRLQWVGRTDSGLQERSLRLG